MLFNAILLAATVSIGVVHGATPTTNNRWSSALLNRRHDIVERLRARVARSHFQRRASAPTCPFARDNEGDCCPTEVLEADGDCCPSDHVYNPSCSPAACCEDGVAYQSGSDGDGPDRCCRSPSIIFTNSFNNQACCPSGIVAGPNCCLDGQVASGNTCISVRQRVKRDADSTSTMVRREDQTRMLLSPDLVVKHLTNNGIFEHEGETYVDHNHRAHNDGILRRLAGKGIYQAMKYATKGGRVYDAERWNSIAFVPISEAFELDVKDVPEIYARLVADDDFKSFHWTGAEFDRDILYSLASGHPDFNETLVNLYR